MFRTLTLAVLALLVSVSGASAIDRTTRAVGPIWSWQASDLTRYSDQMVHVKFVEGSTITWNGSQFAGSGAGDLSLVQAAVAKRGVVEVRPTFAVERTTARAWKATAEARTGKTGPDLSLWFTIQVRGGAAAVAELVNDLNASSAVEIAHPEAKPELAVIEPTKGSEPTSNAVIPDFTGMQTYLYGPPVGLDAPSAWGFAGGKGEGGKFIDVELAWTEDHLDFPFARMFHLGGAPEDPDIGYVNHGTAVLGEVIGQENGFGINGFAPNLEGYGMVAITVGEWPTVPHRFQEAVDNLEAGDVWLIELQMYPPLTGMATPMEYLQVNYDVIWTSTWARDIICVEAGANGAQNLDAAVWGGLFNRNVRDSGAIMVGAGTPNGLVAESFSNYGTRMDVHAWGSQIVTTGYGDLHNEGPQQTRYTAGFGGTSGASPMVTGAALCLTGIARAAGIPFTPELIRQILHDTGTPQQGVRLIGPRPRLGLAANAILATTGVAPAAAPIALRIESAPNPFNELIRLRIDAPDRTAFRVGVYDANGRSVRDLGGLPGGAQTIAWDGRDQRGVALGAGVYFFKIEAPGLDRTVKVQKIH